MKKDLDHIIFVGFVDPTSTEDGEKTITKIMNVTGVKRENISFFYKEKYSPQDIIRNSFVPDKSQKFNFRIGNSLCIASSSIGTQRLTIEMLKKVDIDVRTGYQHIDISALNESELKSWLETGQYTKISEADDSEESAEDILNDILGDFDGGDEDSLLDGLLGEDDSSSQDAYHGDDTGTPGATLTPEPTPEPESAPESIPQSETAPQSTAETTPEPEPTPHPSTKQEPTPPPAPQTEPSPQPTPSPTPGTVSTSTPAPTEDETIYDAEIVSDEEASLRTNAGTIRERSSMGTSFDDLLGSLNSTGDGSVSSSSRYSADNPPISPKDMGVSVPGLSDDTQGEPRHGNSEDTSRYNDLSNERFDAPEATLRDTEEYRRENNIDSTMGQDDSMDYVNQAMKKRKEAVERQKRQQQQERAEIDRENRESGSSLANLQNMVGSKKEADRIDKQDDETAKMYSEGRDRSENAFRPDGTRKNYREYLSESQQREQFVDEKIREDFGNVESLIGKGEVHSDGEDNAYVAKGKGRIILSTAGKGGVGKTLVSIGMASALSLAKAAEARDNPGYKPNRVWLIESDYNSPKLAATFHTGKRHVGNLAALLDKDATASIGNDEVRQCIEDNAVRDKETGMMVLACPPLSVGLSSPSIPMAILMAIRYASQQGDDVIVDHGNLTVGEYSSLDKILARKTAHRVVVVGNMACIDQTQTALDVLCKTTPGSAEKGRNPHSVSVVLNKIRENQYTIAQSKLRPFRVIATIPPIDALREENSVTGDTYLNNAPDDVRKAVYDRCGIMLTRLGYTSLQRYFVAKTSYTGRRTRGKKNVFRRIAEKLAGDKK